MTERRESEMTEEEMAEVEGVATDSGRIPTSPEEGNERLDEFIRAEDQNEAPHEETGVERED